LKLWGTGKPRREFLHVDDLADAVYYVMQKVETPDLYEQGISHLNVGTGKDLTIHELAMLITEIVGFKGKIEYDSSKPDGTPQKLLDVTRINKIGWKHKTLLRNGIEKIYDWIINESN